MVLAIVGFVVALFPVFSISPAMARNDSGSLNDGESALPMTPLTGVWHRLNASSNFTPSHEVLDCRGFQSWTCKFNEHPEADLGFNFSRVFGRFQGSVIPDWGCPDWFVQGICDSATYVVGGRMVFMKPEPNSRPLHVDIELIVTENDGGQILYVYWVDRFACPWYRIFDEALEANPSPYHRDCVFAP